ncbi:hypothetical protein ACO0K7_07255 [Undibacterium sp. Ji67W]|uniref:hypothetical protein n=1 Tax=Undibacterium sp. Ji67W TaxID=3413042 RepID=UPI003BF19AF1
MFGHTPAVAGLVRQLNVNAIVISPWDDPGRHFRTEQEAYQAFIVDGGIGRYAEKLHKALEQEQALKFVIGFSAGASALWINSERECMKKINETVLFYGSRIRDYRDIQPCCPVRLIFAEQEQAFTPQELVNDLRLRGLSAEIVKGTVHGFMNSYSRGSCVKSQTRFTAELLHLLHASKDKAAA